MTTRTSAERRVNRPGLAVARLMFDIGAPIVLYYLLRAAGASYRVALLASAALPAAGTCWTLLRRRRPDPVAVLMVTTLTSAFIISTIAHSPRFLLAKEGLITGVWGAWMLVSARGSRPAALVFARPLMESARVFGGRSWDLLWATEPRFRRIWRASTVMWGVGLMVDALIRIVMSYTLPIDQVPGIGGALYPITFIALQIITNVYYMRAGLYSLLGARWLERPRPGHAHGTRSGPVTTDAPLGTAEREHPNSRHCASPQPHSASQARIDRSPGSARRTAAAGNGTVLPTTAASRPR